MPLGSVPASSRPCGIHSQPGDVGLAGIVIQLALARARRRDKPCPGRRCPRRARHRAPRPATRCSAPWARSIRWPCRFRCGRPCHRARCRRRRRRCGPRRWRRLRAARRSKAARTCRPVDAVNAAAVAGGGIERAIGRFGHAPDHRLVGRENGIDFGRERQAAFAAERDAVEAAADEIVVRVHFPGGGAAGEGSGRRTSEHCREKRRRREWRMENDHSLTST